MSRKRQLKQEKIRWSESLLILAAVLVGALMVFLALGTPLARLANNFFHPYLALPRAAATGIAEQTLLFRSKADLAAAVADLQKRNVELALQSAERTALRAENRRLRELLSLTAPGDFRYVAADIILRDPLDWTGSFTVNRGAQHGLAEGQAVLDCRTDGRGRAVLLGVIESVAARSARVVTLCNPKFRLSAALPDSQTVGFLNVGRARPESCGLAAIGYLPSNRTFALNEPLYTTGYEGAVPAGMLIGTLAVIDPAALPFTSELNRSGAVRPAADFEQLFTVLIAVRERGEAGRP